MTLTVRAAAAASPELEAFLGLPDAIYRSDPHFIPTPREAVVAGLRRPEFQGAQRVLVAMEEGKAVARLVARRSPALRDEADRPYGLLGFFEALDRPEAVGALFDAAISWLRETGAGSILGPMDGDTWHRYRVNTGPWDDPPFLLEPYNPPYYAALWEGYGFEILERYLSTQVDPGVVAAHLAPKHRAAQEAGYVLRRLDLSRFHEELRLLYHLSRVIFAGNFLYSEIPEKEFIALYTGSRRLLDPDLVRFAETEEGRAVGFLFAYPDRFRAVAAMRGERGPLAVLRYLRHRHTDAVDFKTLGVLPEHRRSGVAAALMCQGHLDALRKGYRLANHCLFREGNPSGEMDGGAGRVLRRYHLYQLRSSSPSPGEGERVVRERGPGGEGSGA